MVTSSHGVLETVLLLSSVRDMEAGVLPVVIIQECEDDECIPDMIWCEDTSKLPPTGGEIAFLLLR
jgi:hypothetical protein